MPLLGNQNKLNIVGMIGVRVGDNFYISRGISATEESLAIEAGQLPVDGKYMVSDVGYFEVEDGILTLKGEPRSVSVDGSLEEARQISNTLLRERG